MIKKTFFWVLFLIFFIHPSVAQAQTTYSATDYVILHDKLQKYLQVKNSSEISILIQNLVQANNCTIEYSGVTFTSVYCPSPLNLSAIPFVVRDQIDTLLEPSTTLVKTNYKSLSTYTAHLHKQFGFRGADARVAVLDSGIQTTHPELKTQIIGGQNFVSEDKADINDTIGHGTHVSGIIAAIGHQPQARGIAPESKLWIGKVCTDTGCSVANIMTAIEYIVQNQVATTINISIGGKGTTAENCDDLGDGDALHVAYMSLVNWAVEQGVTIVASAGNEYGGEIKRPACASQAIAVGSTNVHNDVSDFSSHGLALDIVAPGEDIYSTYLQPSYYYISGTSMAAPVVSGIVATMKSLNSFSQAEITQHLYNSSQNLGYSAKKQGHGLLNSYQAINSLCKTKRCYSFSVIEWDFHQSLSPISGFALTKKRHAPLQKGPHGEPGLFFNRRTSMVKISHNPFLYFQNWQFAWKIEFSPTQIRKNQILFSNLHSHKGGYELQVLKGGKLQYTLQDPQKRQVVFQTLEPVISSDPLWQTIELRHNTAPSSQNFGIDILVNGQKVAIKTLPHSSPSQIDLIQSNTPLFLGNNPSKQHPFKGYVKNFSIRLTNE